MPFNFFIVFFGLSNGEPFISQNQKLVVARLHFEAILHRQRSTVSQQYNNYYTAITQIKLLHTYVHYLRTKMFT